MTDFTLPVDVRWADLDANNHVRHSVYYDWGAQARMNFLTSKGLGANVLQEQHFGPILFREECIFRREIRFGDEITINVVDYAEVESKIIITLKKFTERCNETPA